MKTRRQFLGEASCAAIGTTPVLSTLLNLTMANHAAAAGLSGDDSRKTLVCLFLGGGCDTFNVLVPRDQPGGYDEYAASRTNLAIPRDRLLPLNASDPQGRSFGLHPSCPRLAEMFNGVGGDPARRQLSFVANVGTLVRPIVDKESYLNKSVALPRALFSHRDQVEQWQTSVPQGQSLLSGWAGRAADVIHSTLNTEQTAGYYMPMNFSLAGNSTFQIGESEGQFVITRNGALSFTGSERTGPVHRTKNELMRAMVSGPIEEHYRNLFQRTHGRITSNSVERGMEFGQSFDSPGTLAGRDVLEVLSDAGFGGDTLSQNLQAAIKTISIRESLKLRRQTIFVEYGGWDHHSELLNTQAGMLAQLDQALFAYQQALEALGLADDVITFTCSDFARTLRSNGNGTDHAWSGNQFVLGGPVAGGRLLGHYPSLVIDGPDDIGRGGRIFPRTSVDEYFCELLQWFGVQNHDMDHVLPNLGHFHDVTGGSPPLGFLA